MKKTCLVSAAGALVGIIGGCTVGPNYHAPVAKVPEKFTAQTQPASVPATAPPVNIAVWWQSLHDTELNSLVERAVKANLDIEIALMRLQQARAREYYTTGGTLPLAEMSAGAGRGSGTNSTKSRISGPLNAGTNTSGLVEITHVVGFDAGWELDLFGRFRREIEAARDDTQAAADYRNAVLIMVVSDVAREYVNLRALQMRLSIARDTIHTEDQTVTFVQARFKQGLTNELDVVLAKRQLATVKALTAPLEASITQSQSRIAILLGELPQNIFAELSVPADVPFPAGKIDPGLPLDMLRRRPDVQQAERQLAAATARIGVATANLFPRVAITGGLGFQGQGLGRSPVTNSFLWSVGPTAYWPLLDFGTIDSLIEVQDFSTKELLYNYRRTTLTAVEEVDDAIGNYNAQLDRLDQLGDALSDSQRASQLASQRYKRGLTEFLNVLDAQRQLYDLQNQYATARADAVVQFIAVYKALGGGWEGYQSVPAIRHPQPAIIASIQRTISPGRKGADADERPMTHQ